MKKVLSFLITNVIAINITFSQPGVSFNTTGTETALLTMSDDINSINYSGIISNPGTITGSTLVCPNTTGITYSIALVPGATGYTWTVPSGATIASGQGSAVITVNFGIMTGNICVTAENACSTSSQSCLEISFNIGPAVPTAGTNAPGSNLITWNWNDVNSPVSYMWGTTTSYASATNIGTNTFYTQMGLICNTTYSIYIWAYNACGYSSYATLNHTTSACSCGGNGFINTIAGNGGQGYSTDGILAVNTKLNWPDQVAVDWIGNVYIADRNNYRIRKVTFSTGLISTIAGNGATTYTGDGIPATNAGLKSPWGVAVDAAGNVFIADASDRRIREVIASSGLISTVAGNGSAGYNEDGIQATNANLNTPIWLAVDAANNIYIADRYNERIRKVIISTGIISTIAGNGGTGFSDGVIATNAKFNDPMGVAVDASGNVFIADVFNNRIREVTITDGMVKTIAGNGGQGYDTDGIPATNVELHWPDGVAADAAGNVYFVDEINQRVRKVTIADEIISTIIGNGNMGFYGDGGPATSAEISDAVGIAVDNSGNVYVGDLLNNRIRKVCR